MKKHKFRTLIDLLTHVETFSKTKKVSFDSAIKLLLGRIKDLKRKSKKAIFIGNGGSAAIASHIATDFLKNLNIPAITFNDSSLLTCIGNDLGYENVFAKPVEVVGNEGDILFAISSSGKSANIVNAAKAAKKKGLFVITLSAFSARNPLCKIGNINFYVSSYAYGDVEVAHKAICHKIVDLLYEDTKHR